MIFFWIFLIIIFLQRFVELLYARRNERILKSRGAIEFDRKGYLFIVLMHISFFISLVSEKILLHRELNEYWIVFFFIFLLAQLLRYWSIITLGIFWNTKVLVLPNHELVCNGPYKYIPHPNYIAVISEIAVIPLIFSCYITAAVFSVLNLVLLIRRIQIEEGALRNLSLYGSRL